VLAQLAAAQYDYGGGATTTAAGASAPAPAPSAPPNTDGHINIDVAANQTFVFSPANITAPVGTLVTFYIPSGQLTHSVTQSSFANPCTYLAANGSNPAGFDSGLQAAKTFTINITDTKPIWFHCKQVGHCGMGMVGSINAPLNGTNTHDAFVAAAKQIGTAEVQESDSGSPVLTGAGAVATGPPVDSTKTSPSGGSGGSGAPSGALKNVAKAGFYLAAAGVAVSLI